MPTGRVVSVFKQEVQTRTIVDFEKHIYDNCVDVHVDGSKFEGHTMYELIRIGTVTLPGGTKLEGQFTSTDLKKNGVIKTVSKDGKTVLFEKWKLDENGNEVKVEDISKEQFIANYSKEFKSEEKVK